MFLLLVVVNTPELDVDEDDEELPSLEGALFELAGVPEDFLEAGAFAHEEFGALVDPDLIEAVVGGKDDLDDVEHELGVEVHDEGKHDVLQYEQCAEIDLDQRANDAELEHEGRLDIQLP
jgi:hypothetical protein